MTDVRDLLENYLSKEEQNAEFLQYHHRGSCETPCHDCPERNFRIYQNGQHVALPAHPNCDCYYTNVQTKAVGTISTREPAPDVWLKLFGKLPDYYITKEEAEKLGWSPGKNLKHFASGKMIGGDVYRNIPVKLPTKSDRVWHECDIDYVSGKRNSLRLFYSNDGLMFYSPDHGQTEFYYVE